jgi:ComF family protein
MEGYGIHPMGLAIVQWLRELGRGVVDICYPGGCAACGVLQEPAGFLCDGCERELQNIERAGGCYGCGMPLPAGSACPRCRGKGLYPFDQVLRLGVYGGPLRDLILRMKYHRQWTIAQSLARRLLRHGLVEMLLKDDVVIAPIPLYGWRQIGRGFNQAEVVAAELARQTGRPMVHPLARIRPTETQTRLHSKQQRAQNVRGAFALINPKIIDGRPVALVDDVMTTGATLREAGRTLREGKPGELSAIVLAVADPMNRGFTAI